MTRTFLECLLLVPAALVDIIVRLQVRERVKSLNLGLGRELGLSPL
jgi:hypothetical protein